MSILSVAKKDNNGSSLKVEHSLFHNNRVMPAGGLGQIIGNYGHSWQPALNTTVGFCTADNEIGLATQITYLCPNIGR